MQITVNKNGNQRNRLILDFEGTKEQYDEVVKLIEEDRIDELEKFKPNSTWIEPVSEDEDSQSEGEESTKEDEIYDMKKQVLKASIIHMLLELLNNV